MADLLQSETTNHINLKYYNLDEEVLQQIKEEAIAYAIANGLVVASTQNYTHAPFSLFPVEYPRNEFQKGIHLSKLFCHLVDNVSRNTEWIYTTLKSVISKDEFTKRLYSLLQLVEAEGQSQKAYLGMFRSDYMLHQIGQSSQLLQVELNTIASSFGSLSTKVGKLHQFVVERYDTLLPDHLKTVNIAAQLPENAALSKLAMALVQAHEHYNVNQSVILFIVQPGEVNSIDQRLLEYAVWEYGKISVVRKTLLQIHHEATLSKENNGLRIHGKEVSVIYFRAGYTPSDYPSESEWEARLMMEKSNAIKCPSIAYHLVGTKKVQQALAFPGELEKFVSSPEDCKQLRECFAELYGLEKENDNTSRVIEKVLANPQAYVMKPQREGGGNNLYGEEVTTALKNMTPEEIETHIIMSRIFPRQNLAVLVRNNELVIGETISELGMYGVCLFDDGKEIFNEHGGHLLRTKLSSTNEGGVATGFAVLSSPSLC